MTIRWPVRSETRKNVIENDSRRNRVNTPDASRSAVAPVAAAAPVTPTSMGLSMNTSSCTAACAPHQMRAPVQEERHANRDTDEQCPARPAHALPPAPDHQAGVRHQVCHLVDGRVEPFAPGRLPEREPGHLAVDAVGNRCEPEHQRAQDHRLVRGLGKLPRAGDPDEEREKRGDVRRQPHLQQRVAEKPADLAMDVPRDPAVCASCPRLEEGAMPIVAVRRSSRHRAPPLPAPASWPLVRHCTDGCGPHDRRPEQDPTRGAACRLAPATRRRART